MNIEAVICSYLSDKGYEVYADIPKERPDVFVSVERTGGSFSAHRLDHPTIAVQAWSTSRFEAAELMERVDKDLLELISDNRITHIERNSLYNYPDQEAGHPRYQGVYDLVTY